MSDPLVTIEELAERIRTPEATLRFWRYKGTGPKSFKLGRRVMYRQSDIDSWLEDQYAASQNGPAA
ncbi:MAG TPA: helix-turn-helix domain-containing protein [Nocardioides sp.]|uniref:helix-turn-helix transcriptional regulator n=1 Tax=Nocardioides sp. TaxID=35761 RepID=UPI002EDA15A6